MVNERVQSRCVRIRSLFPRAFTSRKSKSREESQRSVQSQPPVPGDGTLDGLKRPRATVGERGKLRGLPPRGDAFPCPLWRRQLLATWFTHEYVNSYPLKGRETVVQRASHSVLAHLVCNGVHHPASAARASSGLG